LIVEWERFPSGFMLLAFYSWNYTEGKNWAPWRRDLPDVIFSRAESDEVQRFIDKISGCMNNHFKDKKYETCFGKNINWTPSVGRG